MLSRVWRQKQYPSEGVENSVAGATFTPLFEADVVVDADARSGRDLFAAKPRESATTGSVPLRLKAGIRSAGSEKVTEFVGQAIPPEGEPPGNVGAELL